MMRNRNEYGLWEEDCFEMQSHKRSLVSCHANNELSGTFTTRVHAFLVELLFGNVGFEERENRSSRENILERQREPITDSTHV